MISCRQSTEWVIRKEQGKLSVKQNVQLLSHLAICSFCRLFSDQSSLIDIAMKTCKSEDAYQLSSKEKEELLKSVQLSIKK